MTAPSSDPSRHRRARQIFDDARDLPPGERDAFVRQVAGGDGPLADAVFEMLRQQGSHRLERIGPYRILELIGEGGMGVVYLAEQKEPIRRRVAIKLIKRGMDTKSVLARFEAERRALSMMEHSCIATVLDGGATDDGQPFFVMENVKGIPITDYCDENKLSLRERIELFRKVCSGVQHAHMKGVMHRDLKPSNVLVTVQDGQPIPKIIDFGLAKATDHHLVEQTIYTEHGVLIGTPEYMSPEQAGLGGLDIDTRTDVYSLGVLLHELLVGELPFSRGELRGGGMLEMQRVIREQEPAKPSTKITTLGDAAGANAAARRMQTGELQRTLRGELDWIVLKALEKDRTRRYQTAQELSADLERYLKDEPVLAGPPTASYVLKKLYRRYRTPMLAAAGMVAALALGLVAAVWQASVAASERTEAMRQKNIADASLTNFRRLKDQVQLDKLVAREKQFVEVSASERDVRAWLQDYETWHATIGDHAASRDTMRGAGRRQPDGTLAFDDPAQQFLFDALQKLVADLESFHAPTGPLARARETLRWVATVRARTIDGHAAKWREVSEWVKTSSEFGISLVPQEGLVPLERDPESGLWEFLFLRSGEAPQRSNGHWVMEERTGIVMVLVPGGKTRIGTDSPDAMPGEQPSHAVTFAPFFLSKYETTQAQWRRLTGTNPSRHKPPEDPEERAQIGAPTIVNPVEGIQWLEADALARRLGLVIPSEGQWEHACRARTTTAWYFGPDRDALMPDAVGLFNAADTPEIEDAAFWPEYRDEFPVTAPVGKYPPNSWGLHDMHGNVAELTRDPFLTYANIARTAGAHFADGTGELVGAESERVGHRGGSWYKRVEAARSFSRKGIARDARFDNIGVRFAREITR